nr:chromate efflux transporter [uncultured Flavobacterium sp.]
MNNDLKELARLFLKLGVIGFGGPAVHIAMMKEEVVTRKRWMTEQYFLNLVGAVNLIPGPNSTELAIHIGHERAGWKGLLVAGLCFIFPAVLITGFFAWIYKKFGKLPEIQPFVYGIKPAIIAIILFAVFPLAKKSLKTIELYSIGILVLILSLLKFNELYLLFGAGFLALFIFGIKNKLFQDTNLSLLPIAIFPFSISQNNLVSNGSLFLIFLKIGAILYGSGYVLFAFLDSELVGAGIITRHQLTDAIAIGQFTPGPVFSAVTFIGYQINDWAGAVLATIGIFLPSFLFVALLNPLVKKMRNSSLFAVFLDAVNVASVAIILAVCVDMGMTVITDWRTICIGLTSLLFAFWFKNINSSLIVIGGSILGYLLTFV